MTVYESQLAFLLLEEYFGPIVTRVCEPLKWGPKTLKLLVDPVHSPPSTVKQALSILINFNFVCYKSPEGNPASCDYSLQTSNILQMFRYSKFMLIARKMYDKSSKESKEAELAVRELLYAGRMTLYRLILKVAICLSQEYGGEQHSLTSIKNVVCQLADNGFLMPIDRVTNDIVPRRIPLTEIEKVSKIDMAKLTNLYRGTDSEFPRNELYWTVNYDRFLIEIRNEILLLAVKRRFGDECETVMKHLLKLSFTKSNPWEGLSSPVSLMVLRDSICNDPSSKVPLQNLKLFIEQIEDDSCSFVQTSFNVANALSVCFKDAFQKLALECISGILNEKFGPKAARVFNIVRDKKFIELEQIPRIAMLADKEAKQITYKLLEENFIQMQELRKPTTGAASGPSKSFILFYVNINSVIKMTLNMAFKNSYNLMVRRKEEQLKHSPIFAKKREADNVAKVLRDQNVTEEQISDTVNDILSPSEMSLLESAQKVLKRLNAAQLQVDEMIILLQVYVMYHKTGPPVPKSTKKKK
ncbi:hypothetical protein V9T40_007286 [Parthenolecanium corni]|uniref:DNA-directed RNA polymerase III subunit RPC3 n=1 Tax=Parthenolecanium corni TaxID=536013 RepID=A0AAN9TW51_9HEMI